MTVQTRRRFLRGTLLGGAYALLASPFSSATIRTQQKPAPKVITRKLGKTGIEIPVVSMGVMRSDNPGLVRAALAGGMVHLDTAHMYMKGRNEEMLGEVLKEYPRTSYVIATKVPPESSKEAYLAKLDLSLQRLHLDHVDILYLHGVGSKEGVLDPVMLEAMKAAKLSGKALHVGVSTHHDEPEVIDAAVASGVYEVVLTAVNFRQEYYPALRTSIAKATAAGLGIVGMKTMAGAFLDKERKKPINCKAALKWVLQDPNVTTTIPGITTFEQLAENSSVNSDITMTPEEQTALAQSKTETGLFCPGCTDCTGQCRKSLPVRDLMRAYMYAYGYAEPSMAKELLHDLALSSTPCVDCDSCTVECAHGFAVRDRISDVSRLADVPAEFLA